jgi:hypothetical protein
MNLSRFGKQSVFSLITALVVACSSKDSGFGSPVTPGNGDGGMIEIIDPGAGVIGHLRGKVSAPNGTMPIANALVYLTDAKPLPAPEKVYCDECVSLPDRSVSALSNERGEFDLGVKVVGKKFLVVQKGGFRRVREVTVAAGDASLPNALTSLPAKTDLAAGDEVPRMTVVHGGYDEIEASLQKLGIDKSAIDTVGSALIGVAAKGFLTDVGKVNDRHIVFLPCGDFTQPMPNIDLSIEKGIQDNLRAFVAAGGRLYVTDWHYDFIARTFPGFVNFAGASEVACSGCERQTYDADATVEDPALKSWLGAQSITNFKLQKNYTGISSVQAQSVTVNGQTRTITPRVWVSGSRSGGAKKPATVSFEYGCGKVLFSTYHTEPFSMDLTEQEKTLLGVLLEVNVCNGSPTGLK